MNRRMHNEQGAALITVILIAAIAASAAAAVAVAVRQQIEIHRSGYVLQHGQLMQQLLASEAAAQVTLETDRRDSETDHAGEAWGKERTADIEGGMVTGRITDLQGGLNLNGLGGGNNPLGAPSTQRLTRLLSSLELPESLAASILDWTDADGEPSGNGGAEDITYLGGELPYRSANQPLASPSELRLINGIDTERYATLAPMVTALPGGTAINVNTAPAQVLGSLFEGLEIHAESLAKERDQAPYTSAEQFIARVTRLLGRDENDEPLATDGLTVASDYFLYSAEAVYGDVRGQLYSLMLRDTEGRVHVLRRSREGF